LLPGVDLAAATLARGQFHDVVLIEDVAAVRIARRPEAGRLLERRSRLLRAMAALDLPFAVPEPLGEVMEVDGRAAVVTAWVPGAAQPRGTGDPQRLAALLAALRDVPLEGVEPLLDEPHAYAGRSGWLRLMHDDVIPRLGTSVRDEARRRIDAAASLPAVPASLVHGDLAGDNLRWSETGELLGVLDWDLAQGFDPAVDAACLAWHGWDNVKAAVDAETYRRARIWQATFGIEQVGAAISNGEPPEVIDQYAAAATKRLS
jgi:aminoglycoside phosphotransferase (APT) family kinase protein